MRTNQKQLRLIKYGLKPSTVTRLTESQVDSLYKNLSKSKKETKEDTNEKVMVSSKNAAEVEKLKQAGATFEVYEEMSEDDTTVDVDNANKGEYTQNKIQEPSPDGTDDERGSIEEEYKNLSEKFESKKQQRYFFSKCGDGKTKEQKKWCKMAEEFAEKTNFKKLPEKKKETNEEGMSNFTNKVASAYAGGVKKQLNPDLIKPTFESELERKIMRLVEKHITPKMSKKEFLNIVKEQGPKTAPARPGVRPDVDTPTRPSKPATPYKPKPGVKPSPKAKLPKWLTFNSIGIKLK